MLLGHETTSGLLSFLFYNFLRHPETFQEAQQEVDRVIGKGVITVDHMSKLPYITACLRETLRLTPTIAGTGIGAQPDSTEDPTRLGGGSYVVPRNVNFFYVLNKVQKDPTVYGDDAELFRPERMLDESFKQLPKNAWKVSKAYLTCHRTCTSMFRFYSKCATLMVMWTALRQWC